MMRGRFLHNQLLVAPLAEALRQSGWQVNVEFHVRSETYTGFIDLKASRDGQVLAVEAELTPRRVKNDIAKAIAMNASELWIVVPEYHAARAVRAVVARHAARKKLPIRVLTQGQAIQRVKGCFPLISMLNEQEENQKVPHKNLCR